MSRPPRRIGILGLGAIGQAVARALASRMPGLVLVGATRRDAGRARTFLAGLPRTPPLLRVEELLARADIVVEAATQAALIELAPSILDAGRDLVVLSVGALLDHPEWVARAAARGARIHAPSAAIAGLDGLKGGLGRRASGLRPHGDAEAPPRAGRRAWRRPARPRSDHHTNARLRGHRSGGVPRVPRQRNVSLAGLGPDRTRIRIHADPSIERNRHTVTAAGAFGRLRIKIENVPSENPRTGKLAYLSTIAYLRDLAAPLRVGT